MDTIFMSGHTEVPKGFEEFGASYHKIRKPSMSLGTNHLAQ